MAPIVAFLILFVGVGLGLFAGLVICATTELGDLALGTVSREALKCAAVSAVVAAAGAGLFALVQTPKVFVAVVPVYYIALKLGWLEISKPELLVVAISTIVSLMIVISLAAKIAF